MAKPISHEYNLEVKAQVEDFHGWSMPISYSGIIDEYLFTRESASLFDVSHMGRLLVTGSEASKYLDHLITNNVTKLKVNKALYTMLLNQDSGIIDDLIIYKLETEKYFIVCNAANKTKVISHCEKELNNFSAKLMDLSDKVAQIAIQGPKAKALTEKYLKLENSIPYFNFKEIDFAGEKLLITATGYTGEKGYELYAKADTLMHIWRELLKNPELRCAGLGARDLLRLEAGYCLHGNDIDESTSPIEAGLDWTVDFSKDNFIGKENAKRKSKILKGLVFPEAQRLIPRHGTKVFNEAEEEIGEITSGCFSQILNRAIALCYVKNLNHENSKIVNVKIRNKIFIAELSPTWFYRNIKGKEISYEKVF